jgi:hypothetical protein
MATKNMFLITNASGAIIAAHVQENPTYEGGRTFILPAKSEHALHRISDVPEEICNLSNPTEFQEAITRHFTSEHAQVKRTSAEEIALTPVFLGSFQKEKSRSVLIISAKGAEGGLKEGRN